MSKKSVALLKSWARSFFAACTAVISVSLANNIAIDPKAVLTAGALAVLPVIQRWLDKSDPAFGKE